MKAERKIIFLTVVISLTKSKFLQGASSWNALVFI